MEWTWIEVEEGYEGRRDGCDCSEEERKERREKKMMRIKRRCEAG